MHTIQSSPKSKSWGLSSFASNHVYNRQAVFATAGLHRAVVGASCLPNFHVRESVLLFVRLKLKQRSRERCRRRGTPPPPVPGPAPHSPTPAIPAPPRPPAPPKHRDLDIYNRGAPHLVKNSGTTKEERDSFGSWLEGGKVADAFRWFHPDARGAYTFWSVRANAVG